MPEPEEQRMAPEAAEETQQPLCANCMTPYTEGEDFCRKCGMPISSLATIDPIMHIYSQGWAYRRATSSRGHAAGLLFWGMWLMFGPVLLVNVSALVGTLRHGLPAGADLLVLGISALYGLLLWKTTTAYLARRVRQPVPDEQPDREDERLPVVRDESPASASDTPTVSADAHHIPERDYPIACQACGADLTGLGAQGQCPACGERFVRADRLFDTYGPELFIPGAEPPPAPQPAPSEPPTRRGPWVSVFWFFVLLVAFSIPLLMPTEGGGLGLVIILLVIVVLAALVQSLRSAGNDDSSNETRD